MPQHFKIPVHECKPTARQGKEVQFEAWQRDARKAAQFRQCNSQMQFKTRQLKVTQVTARQRSEKHDNSRRSRTGERKARGGGGAREKECQAG